MNVPKKSGKCSGNLQFYVGATHNMAEHIGKGLGI